MSRDTTEPRALSAALAGPAFRTRSAGMAMHSATRHVERWAPEAGATRVRSLRALGFVDRLVSPWIETAQRSASLRLFSQYATRGTPEREGAAVSWVFPRPWYQDELDWMAAARQQTARAVSRPDATPPTMFTTRGTYVAPSAPAPSQAVMPAALYEYVAPSLSIAEPRPDIAGVGFGGSGAARAEAYSPLVSLAAVQAAELMSRTVAPLVQSPSGGASTVGRASPALRQVLTAMLERAATSTAPAEAAPSRLAMQAPELVTPPAPRPDGEVAADPATQGLSPSQLADHYAEQRARIVEVQRIAQQAAQREIQRTEAELRQNVTTAATTTTSPGASVEQAAGEHQQARAAAERARIAERVAHQQRLHEQARSEAAEHARAAALASAAETTGRRDEPAAAPASDEVRAPAEVTAAIAALPPELATYLAQRPTRPASVVQAVSELADVLRTAELLVRSGAASAPVEVTRGPRVMMPAGLGGLVASVDRAQAVRVPSSATVAAPAPSAPAPRRDVRVPALPFLRGAAPAAQSSAGSTALGATAAATPAGLGHIAWADRWLARFAGAAPQSLDVIAAAASPSPQARLSALASAAPDSVFVAPIFDTTREPVRPGAIPTARQVPAEPARVAPTSAEPAAVEQLVERFDDDAETPDDVFAQIAAAAAARRATPATTRAAAPSSAASASASAPSTTPGAAQDEPRPTMADALAHAAPSAPGAGLAAQIAASPFAPALRHIVALPATASFDVRALFGAGLSATYLAGLLEPAAHELVTDIATPAWATPMLGADALAADREREIPSWDPTYVAPELASDAIPSADEEQPLTTLRTALLSWTVDESRPGEAIAPQLEGTGPATPVTPVPPRAPAAASHAMLEAMSLPLLADPVMSPVESASAWTAPGMVAQRAEGWSVAQERSVSDLSFDFVPPEIVLAARVYGLGPAEAAQALRLAVAGPGQLAAMASAVDRTFVQALAIDHERRDAQGVGAGRAPARAASSITTAYPLPTGEVAAAVSPAAAPASPAALAFGVERRAPRGAFLWPAATVSALGLTAAAPDGMQSMSVAALELLAAQAVAELGTYAALGERADAEADHGTEHGAEASGTALVEPARPHAAGAAEPSEADVLDAAVAMVPAGRRARFEALYVALAQSPTARSWSPAARAARALALAGRGEDAPLSAYERAASAWDVLPVVYATEGTMEPGDLRDLRGADRLSAGEARARGRVAGRPGDLSLDPVLPVDARPGLGVLSARAGEALGSYVTATPAPVVATPAASSSSSSSREVMSPAMRAPTAAQELVRTGRPAGRHGGGEVEIPPWFEAAARKMLEERSGVSEGISLAELTLVSAAPASHVAASKVAAPSAAPLAPSPAGAAGPSQGAPQIDVEKVANEIYRQILIMMDAARARNGEPYL